MSGILPALSGKKVIAALLRAGFFEHHTTGGHVIMRHESVLSRRVTIPNHQRDLKKGTLYSIIKQSGLSVEEFIALL